MFGIFGKRKPKTALDALIIQIYGSLDHKKTANLGQAESLAFNELLSETINRELVHQKASELFDGPMPYSTKDLALSVALAFFQDPKYKSQLSDVQLLARLQLIEWINEGSVARPLAMVFENTLYERFKPD
jgi:hypothetical protein